MTLSKPVFAIAGHSPSKVALSPRKTPAIIGMGLLEAVPDDTLLELSRQSDGRVSMNNGKIGRFGWKASQPTIVAQIKGALKHDMGVMTEGNEALDCTNGCVKGKSKLEEKDVELLETYVALLAVPPRANPEDPLVLEGEKIFEQLTCQSCHVATLRTAQAKHPELQNQTIHPYTDLLIHDMGPGLADDAPGESAKMWRTSPLWGLKNVKHSTNDFEERFHSGDNTVTYLDTHDAVKNNPIQLLHDGRAHSLAEAILWHGGEAQESVDKYRTLSKKERLALEAFLWDL